MEKEIIICVHGMGGNAAEADHYRPLSPSAAIDGFCARTGAALTVMPGGEHWFHTDAEMTFLDRFVRGEV